MIIFSHDSDDLYQWNSLQSAVGHEYQSELSKHVSQVDAAKGFGGKFGVQKDRVDKASQWKNLQSQQEGDIFLEIDLFVSADNI